MIRLAATSLGKTFMLDPMHFGALQQIGLPVQTFRPTSGSTSHYTHGLHMSLVEYVSLIQQSSSRRGRTWSSSLCA